MHKKLLKLAAALCSLAVTVTLFGCADTSWAVNVDGIKVPSGVYITFLMQARSQVLQQASSAASGSSAVSDPWSQKIDSTDAQTWAINQALQSCEQLAEVEKLCTQRKITLTKDEASSAAALASSSTSPYGDYYTKNGVSNDSVARIIGDYRILEQKLLDSYYAAGGSQAVSEADLKNYYNTNFVRVKHIVLLTTDSSGNAMTTEQAAAVQTNANNILKKATAKNADFDALMKQYSQDVDSTTKAVNNPDGYIFSKSSGQNAGYDTTFVDTAFSMKVGDIKMVQTSYGYDIMQKLQVNQNYDFYNTNKTGILDEMKSADFQKIITDAVSKAKITKNQSAINHYSPKKITDPSQPASAAS